MIGRGPVRVTASVPVIGLSPLTRGADIDLAAAALILRLFGMGKRPLVLWCAKTAPIKVSEGDARWPEASFLSSFAPVWAGSVPPDDLGQADCILALSQDRAVEADITLRAVKAHQGAGNGLAWPLGPVLSGAVDGLVLSDDPRARRGAELPDPLAAKPQVTGRVQMLQTGMDWSQVRVLAFAGGGDPGAIFAAVRKAGAELVDGIAVEGRDPLPPALIQRLSREAAGHRAALATTERDMLRLPPAARREVLALPIRLEVPDWTPLDTILSGL